MHKPPQVEQISRERLRIEAGLEIFSCAYRVSGGRRLESANAALEAAVASVPGPDRRWTRIMAEEQETPSRWLIRLELARRAEPA